MEGHHFQGSPGGASVSNSMCNLFGCGFCRGCCFVLRFCCCCILIVVAVPRHRMFMFLPLYWVEERHTLLSRGLAVNMLGCYACVQVVCWRGAAESPADGRKNQPNQLHNQPVCNPPLMPTLRVYIYIYYTGAPETFWLSVNSAHRVAKSETECCNLCFRIREIYCL